MGFSRSTLFSIFLVFLTGFSLLTPANSAADIFSLAFKGCSKQTISDNSSFQDTVTALFSALISQSSSAHFFKSSSGSGQNSVLGLFQCRGDLSNADCSSCIRQIAEKSSDLCGKSIAARIQLAGCYVHYEIAASQQVSGTELLYKTCSGSRESFEEKRDTAFAALESGIAGGSGFYATTYASVYVIAQCEGDLSVADCSECVKEAVQRAEVECGNSIAGQVYLNRCYMSYSYYPHGIPGHSSDY
ncbi:plasmodesmata-located protein 3-like isoform X2 [Magnolia sinica]|uniref:plasmodesmata-located protein 3-like isoform X2 n=1 Tax=Magnolia sinica TaxID=86752 RepID=UPI00265A116D|nr:plasmodesmata-located protein 3-like isoform X2 [Magnolia sinica]